MPVTSSYEYRQAQSETFTSKMIPALARALTTADNLAALWVQDLHDLENEYYLNSVVNGNEGIQLSFDPWKDRISVSAVWPKFPDGQSWWPSRVNEPSPTITVSAERSHESIAKAIVSRFLPVYRALLEKAYAQIAEATAYEHKAKANLERIIAAGALYLRRSNRNTDAAANIHAAPGIGYGSIRVSAESVTFDHFNTTPEFAARVFALIEQYGKDFPKGGDTENKS